MAYNNVTSRTDAAALIPEEVSRELIRTSTAESAVLSLFRRVNVGRAQVLGKVRHSATELSGPLTAEAVVRIFERIIDEACRAEREASSRRE